MSSHSTRRMSWRRIAATAGASVALGAATLFAAPPASADVLDDLAAQYSTGSGAGQVANLLNKAIAMRTQGINPSPASLAAVKSAMNKGPSQKSLIEALQGVVSYQMKKADQYGLGGGPATVEPVGPPTGPFNESQPGNPGNPMNDVDGPFGMPGRA